MTNDEIFDRFEDEPAPLLPILHAFHERDSFVSDDAIVVISDRLRIPKADLFGTVTFYHHLSRTPGGQATPRVCDGPVCCLNGAAALQAELGGESMPCPGRCDEPVPVLFGNVTKFGANAASLQQRASLLPPDARGEECVFAQIREPGRAGLDGYRRTDGYQGLEKALKLSPAKVLDVMSESGLCGRGGAGFPTARKWKAVRDAAGDKKTLVCNADEGEPGCFKDRALMDHDPHALIEGMAIAAYATGAQLGFIYLRYEYPETLQVLKTALEEAKKLGIVGESVLDSGHPFELYIRRGAGAYICGEETSLLNSLEGKHPFPRNRPPYPVTSGFEETPTAVNNVETLCCVAPILLRGAAWYQSLGVGDNAGTKVISLSGDVTRPGNYEVPIGLPLKTLLYDWAGGPLPGRSFKAATMAGLSGGFIGGSDLDEVTLDETSLRAKGSFLGAGGIMVFDDRRDMVETARQAMSFFAHESCGKCFPCRIGTQRLTERLGQTAGPRSLALWKEEVHDIGKTMSATSACGLGVAAPLVTESLLKYFGSEVDAKLQPKNGVSS